MKNQYFGDVNDYRKYGLLRTLANNGQHKIGLCWMLTADDGRNDGNSIRYLNDPQRWRQYDPPLFDLLKKSVIADGSRSIASVENEKVLPGAKFHSEVLTDSLSQRTAYFKGMREKLATCELIFFDPDNGIETKSTMKGRRNSAKYVYWDEIGETFQAGHSILLYQQFRREERTAFIQRAVAEFQARLSPSKTYWFRTPQVVYFLGVQEKHAEYLASRVKLISEQWGSQIQAGLR
ncbi:MAG: hypothetical protein WA821_13880 [Anaerolineales bacterium]